MFRLTLLYAIIGGLSLLGTISLIGGGYRYPLMNIVFGIAQIILFIILL